jgi:tetratricopeptide (TPR) repeat protein
LAEQARLILSIDPLPRIRRAAKRPIRPHVAVIYASADGNLVADGPLTWSRRFLSIYRTRYEVDMSDQYHDFDIALPARGDFRSFEASVNVGFRVIDPTEVVRRNLDDGLALVSRYSVDSLREIARRFSSTEIEEAEDALNSAFREPLTLADGITIFRCRVRLTPDSSTREQRQRELEAVRSHESWADRQMLLASFGERQVSGRDLLQLHLAAYPEDTEGAFQMWLKLAATEIEHDKSLLGLLQLLLDQKLLEPADIEFLRSQAVAQVRNLAVPSDTNRGESLTRALPPILADTGELESADVEPDQSVRGGIAEIIVRSTETTKRGTAFRVGRRLLVTAAHVVETSLPVTSLDVRLPGESQSRPGTLLYSDASSDIAIIEAAPSSEDSVQDTNSAQSYVFDVLSKLAAALGSRYARNTNIEDLSGTIQLYREALRLADRLDPRQAPMMSNLAAALRTRFERAGDTSDLDEAVSLLRQALDATPASQPERPVMMSNLAAALQTRFERAGDTSDLDEAVSLLRQALDTIPVGYTRHARIESLLSRARALRARTGAI